MAAIVIKQPNGLYGRFSSIVDNYTHYNLTGSDMFEVMRDEFGRATAREFMAKADTEYPERFEEELETIQSIHGKKEANAIRKKLSAGSTIPKCVQENLLNMAGVDMKTVRWDVERNTFVKLPA